MRLFHKWLSSFASTGYWLKLVYPRSSCFLYPGQKWAGGRDGSRLRAHGFPADLSVVPIHIKQLTTTCSASLRESSALFWPRQAPAFTSAQSHTKAHIHIFLKICYYFFNYVAGDIKFPWRCWMVTMLKNTLLDDSTARGSGALFGSIFYRPSLHSQHWMLSVVQEIPLLTTEIKCDSRILPFHMKCMPCVSIPFPMKLRKGDRNQPSSWMKTDLKHEW